MRRKVEGEVSLEVVKRGFKGLKRLKGSKGLKRLKRLTLNVKRLLTFETLTLNCILKNVHLPTGRQVCVLPSAPICGKPSITTILKKINYKNNEPAFAGSKQ
jgi:hypothetical protein